MVLYVVHMSNHMLFLEVKLSSLPDTFLWYDTRDFNVSPCFFLVLSAFYVCLWGMGLLCAEVVQIYGDNQYRRNHKVC